MRILIKIFLIGLIGFFILGCGGGSSSNPEELSPKEQVDILVSSVDGRVIEKDDPIVLEFKSLIGTLNEDKIILYRGEEKLEKQINKDSKKLTITPNAVLENGEYIIVLQKGVTSKVTKDITISFFVGDDGKPPKVLEVKSYDGDNIRIEFNKKFKEMGVMKIILSKDEDETNKENIDVKELDGNYTLEVSAVDGLQKGIKYWISIKEGAVIDTNGRLSQEYKTNIKIPLPTTQKWVKHNDMEYKIFYEDVKKDDAQEACAGKDSILATDVHSALLNKLGANKDKQYWYKNMGKVRKFKIQNKGWASVDGEKSEKNSYICQRFPAMADSDWISIDGVDEYEFKVYGKTSHTCKNEEKLLIKADFNGLSLGDIASELDLNEKYRYWLMDGASKKYLYYGSLAWRTQKDSTIAYSICKTKKKIRLKTQINKKISSKQNLVLEFSQDIASIEKIVLKNITDGWDKTLTTSDYATASKNLTIKALILEGDKKYRLIIEENAINNLSKEVDLEFSTKSSSAFDCQVGFSEYPKDSKECYKAVDEKKTWQKAQEACKNSNASLSPKDKIQSIIDDYKSSSKDLTKELTFGDITLTTQKTYWLEEKDSSYGNKVYQNYNGAKWSLGSGSKTSENYYLCYYKKIKPEVTKISPVKDSINVSTKAKIKITFSEKMKDFTRLGSKANMKISDDVGSKVKIKEHEFDDKTLIITLENDFATNKKYTIILNPSTASKKIVDIYDNELEEYSSSFTTNNVASTCSGEEIDGKCYIWVKTKKNWSDANSHCTTLGGKLLSKDSDYVKLTEIANTLGLKSQDSSYNDLRYWMKEAFNGGNHYTMQNYSGTWKSNGLNYASDTKELEFVCEK